MDFQIEEIIPEVCSQSHMKMQGTDAFWKVNLLQNYFCFPLEKPLKLGGSFLLGESYDINIIFQQCRASATRTCKAQNIIDELTKKVFINIMTPVMALDPSSSDVVSFFYQSQWTTISDQIPKSSVITFKKVNIEIDQAVLFQEIQSSERVTFSKYREMVYSLEEDEIFQFQLQVDSQFDTVSVSYKKIQQVIAEIGGFVNIAFVLLGVVFSRFIEIDFYNTVLQHNITLLSEVTQDIPLEKENQTMKAKQTPDKQKRNFNSSVTPAEKQLKAKEITETDSEKESNIKKIFREKSFQSLDVLKIGLGIQKNEKHALYQAAKQEIENGLSIESMIKLKQEFEIMKYLVLDKQSFIDFQQISQKSIIHCVSPPQSQRPQELITQTQFEIEEQMISSMNRFIYDEIRNNDQYSTLPQTPINSLKQQQGKQLDTLADRIQFYLDNIYSRQGQVLEQVKQNSILNIYDS